MSQNARVEQQELDLPGLGNEIDVLSKVIGTMQERLGWEDSSEPTLKQEPTRHARSDVGEELKQRILAIRYMREKLDRMLPAIDAIAKMATT